MRQFAYCACISFFSNNANIQYFYCISPSVCLAQKTVLTKSRLFDKHFVLIIIPQTINPSAVYLPTRYPTTNNNLSMYQKFIIAQPYINATVTGLYIHFLHL